MMISKWLACALPKFRNLLQRSVDDMTISVCDYEFSQGSEGPDVQQTVFVLEADDVQCKHVALCPATAWDKVASMVSSSVQIQRGYRLTSEGESPLQLTDDLVELLDGTTCIEVGEGHLLIYRRGHLVSPPLIEFFVKEGTVAYGVIADTLEKLPQ